MSMKTYIKLGVIFLSIMQVLCGCTISKDPNQEPEEIKQESIGVSQQDKIIKTPYRGFFQKEMELSAYEPVKGAYLGAYVLANPEIEFDITRFEEAVNKDVALALRHYQIGDPFPDKWLLQCLARKKAPHIVITPADAKSPYDLEVLEETALKLKNPYGIPVFIEFYPNAKGFGDPQEYISYFQQAKEVFADHVPNSVFVWSMDMDDIYDSMVYYPGDDYVDWVGISMYFPIYKDKERFHVDIGETLDYFYHMYQGKKPMMISKLAISHYSNKDHTFYLEEAGEIMEQIYKVIPTQYPRIKGINYIDINNINMAPNNKGNDNFRVSTEPKITKIYKDAIRDPYYLQTVGDSQAGPATQWLKMQTPFYDWNNHLYVLEETIVYDWEIDLTKEMKEAKKIISGSGYYDLDKLVELMGYRYTVKDNIVRIDQKK